MQWVAAHTDFTNPTMLVAALFAVAFVGLSKGGLTGFGLLGVPLLALYMPPLQAAALLLPSYILMDITALWTWRRYKDWQIIKDMLPAALLGIALGAVLASVTSDALIILIVGVIAISFVLRQAWLRARNPHQVQPRNPNKARFWGTISGFTSFIAHAGGPPFSVYTLPLRLDPKILTGSATIYFAAVNLVKIIPYLWLGEFSLHWIGSTLILTPVTVLFVLIGAWIVKRMDAKIFYPLTYSMIALIGLKLIWDGLSAL